MPLRPPKISYGPLWERTRASAVRSWWLTAKVLCHLVQKSFYWISSVWFLSKPGYQRDFLLKLQKQWVQRELYAFLSARYFQEFIVHYSASLAGFELYLLSQAADRELRNFGNLNIVLIWVEIFFLLASASRPALGPTQLLVHLVPGIVYPGVKRLGPEADPVISIQSRGQERVELYLRSLIRVYGVVRKKYQGLLLYESE
jgi:hypothetical protein